MGSRTFLYDAVALLDTISGFIHVIQHHMWASYYATEITHVHQIQMIFKLSENQLNTCLMKNV